MPRGVNTNRDDRRRPPSRDLTEAAYRARAHGGRVLRNRDTGELHIVSPSGANWNTYAQSDNHLRGGDLSPVAKKDALEDVTDVFDGER